MSRLDAVIVGTGPAGLSAAVNLKIREKSFRLFGPGDLSRKLTAAPRIGNYLGLPGISGKELGERFLAHLKEMEIEISGGQVSTVYPMGDYFSVAVAGDILEATAVILAVGAFEGRPFPGERELLGRGVGYCATCDAPLYRGKTVAIIGYGDEAVREADFVSGIASAIYYIPAKKAGISPNEKVRVIEKKVSGIVGDKKVRALMLDGTELEVDGVFILRESVAPDSLVPGLALADGFIKTDAMMRTNITGLFAAGDCTGKPHQYMRAAGQGQTAALAAVSYIDKLKK